MKGRIVDLNGIPPVVKQLNVGNVEVKRAAGYFLATICEDVEFHADLFKEGAFQAIVSLVRPSSPNYHPTLLCRTLADSWLTLANHCSRRDQLTLINSLYQHPINPP